MKYFAIFFTLLIFLSCENIESNSTNFDFVIIGNVKNGNGIKVSLIPEGSSMENRVISIVKDGKFRFEGKSGNIQSATLRFESDILQLKGAYSTSMILLEPGVIEFNCEITGKEDNYRFSFPTYEHGDKNIELLNFFYKYENTAQGGTMVYGDSVKNDSMVRLIYPTLRSNVLTIFEDQFKNGTPEVSSILFHEVIIKRLFSRGMFDENNINLKDKKRIGKLFYGVDSTHITREKYNMMNDVVFQLNDENDVVRSFIDFTALDTDSSEHRISDIVEQNEYTIIYFWFTECRPCRVFNKSMVDQYSYLKGKNIEVIGINMDDSKEKWKKSTYQDGIEWINLFVGNDSGLEIKYGIRGFPFKILIDKEFRTLNEKIKTSEDIVSWAAKIE